MLVIAAIFIAFVVGMMVGAFATWCAMIWQGIMSLSDKVNP